MWGACRPVTLATFRMSVEARLCQGCAHSAHPQGSALIESRGSMLQAVLFFQTSSKDELMTDPSASLLTERLR